MSRSTSTHLDRKGRNHRPCSALIVYKPHGVTPLHTEIMQLIPQLGHFGVVYLKIKQVIPETLQIVNARSIPTGRLKHCAAWRSRFGTSACASTSTSTSTCAFTSASPSPCCASRASQMGCSASNALGHNIACYSTEQRP